MRKVELLAPAGDLEKLKIAIDYGADAVYCGGEIFSLRSSSQMNLEQLTEGVNYAHERGKKVYLTVNIFAHNIDISELDKFMLQISNIQIDAFIVSDPGIILWFREHLPDAELHLSTQSNTTNYQSAKFWHNQGIKRIVLARELSLEEINQIRVNTPDEMELESFVHGAMCISYSGRCLLSNFMVGRDANQGLCAHSCRWKYSLVEEQRPGEYYPIIEDDRGSYILNSKDLCMIEHLPELIESGIDSFKIEGRNKSIFYVATVVGAYRKAIDAYYENPREYKFNEIWLDELSRSSHRLYTTGFYFNKPDKEDQNYETSQYIRNYSFVGLVKEYNKDTGIATIEQRNKFSLGDVIEVFGPSIDTFTQTVNVLLDSEENPIESAPHPQQIVKLKMREPACENSMVSVQK